MVTSVGWNVTLVRARFDGEVEIAKRVLLVVFWIIDERVTLRISSCSAAAWDGGIKKLVECVTRADLDWSGPVVCLSQALGLT